MSPRQPSPGRPTTTRRPRRSVRPAAGTATTGAGGRPASAPRSPSWTQTNEGGAGEAHQAGPGPPKRAADQPAQSPATYRTSRLRLPERRSHVLHELHRVHRAVERRVPVQVYLEVQVRAGRVAAGTGVPDWLTGRHLLAHLHERPGNLVAVSGGY